MKKLFLIVLVALSLSADVHTILVSGVALHKDKADKWGEEFNEKNYGIGYRYSFEKSIFILSYSALILKDSYSNTMYNLSAGVGYNVIDIDDIGLNVGFDIGASSKQVKYRHIDNYSEYFYFKREILPILFPTATIYVKDFSINLVFIPEIEYKNKKVDQTTYINIGYSF